MSLTHEDRVKKKELEAERDSDIIKKTINGDRKSSNAEILLILTELFENYPDMRFEQFLSCLIGGTLDFYRESSKTLDIINQSAKVYGWKK
jgi:hypothetical protein